MNDASREFTSIPSIDSIERLPRVGKIALGLKVNAKVEMLRDWGGHTKGQVVLMGGNVAALAAQKVVRIVKQGRDHPKEVDYFVFRPPDDEDENARMPAEIFARLVEHYGSRPRVLDVVLPDEDPAVWFPFAYKLYGASGLKCKGDGRQAARVATMEPFSEPKDGPKADELREIECPGPECPYYRKKECRHIGHLMVMLPEVTVAGVFQIDTGSFHSRVGILNDAKLVRALFGRVSNLVTKHPVGDPPQRRTLLVLTREVKATRGGGTARNHWPMRLRVRDAVSLNLAALDAMRLPSAVSLRLPPPDEMPLDLIPTRLHAAPEAGGQVLTCSCGNTRFVTVTVGGRPMFVCPECSALLDDVGESRTCECGAAEWSAGDNGAFCRACGSALQTEAVGQDGDAASGAADVPQDEDSAPEGADANTEPEPARTPAAAPAPAADADVFDEPAAAAKPAAGGTQQAWDF